MNRAVSLLFTNVKRWATILALSGLVAGLFAVSAAAAPLNVVVTVPDLGDITAAVGGENVQVTALVRGGEDPHFIQAKPSFIRHLAAADLFIQVGLELESGWVPLLLQGARNSTILPGERGHLDASQAVSSLILTSAPVVGSVGAGRAHGDVPPNGNPHYLTDPLCGIFVARLIAERLTTLDPSGSGAYRENLRRFEHRVGAAVFGEALTAKIGSERLFQLVEEGRLEEGALGARLPEEVVNILRLKGRTVIADHNIWPYFARRFRITVVDTLEPFAGVPPTTKQVEKVIAEVREQGISLLLAAPYYDERHANFVAANTGITVVTMAHQVGSVPEVQSYPELIQYNLRALSKQ